MNGNYRTLIAYLEHENYYKNMYNLILRNYKTYKINLHNSNNE